MALLVRQALDHLNQTLDGGLRPPLDGLTILNEAGEFLTSMQRWKWLERPPYLLNMVGGQDYVDFPPDFRELIAYDATQSLVNSLHMTGHASLLALRTNEIQVSSWNFWSSIVYYADDTVDRGIPTARLEFWPTPVSDDPGGLTIIYRAGWVPVTDDEGVIAVPVWCHTLFLHIARAIVRGYEEEDSGTTSQRLAEIMAGPLFSVAVDQDGAVQGDLGPLEGGAAQGQGVVRSWDYAVHDVT